MSDKELPRFPPQQEDEFRSARESRETSRSGNSRSGTRSHQSYYRRDSEWSRPSRNNSDATDPRWGGRAIQLESSRDNLRRGSLSPSERTERTTAMSPSGGWGRDQKIAYVDGLMRDSRADLKESDTSKMVIGSPTVGAWDIVRSGRRDTGTEGLEVCRHCTHAQLQSHLASGVSSPVGTIKEEEHLPESKPRRYTCCGLRPAAFYAMFIVSLLLIVGGVIGGVLGTKALRPTAVTATASATPKPPTSSSNDAQQPKAVVLPSNPLPGTPMSVITYSTNVSKKAEDNQVIAAYYQENSGKVQELKYQGAVSGWKTSKPIFTDARNYTGLAAFTRLNGTDRTNHIFYVTKDNTLFEKRSSEKAPSWDHSPECVGKFAFKVNGTSATATDNGGLRMAAVYSPNFANGPGARLFYHASDDTTAPYVQELIWDQTNNSWTTGAKIADAMSTSHLTATVDKTVLRLFYSADNGTLRESFMYLNTTKEKQGVYFRGMSQPGVLADRPDGPLSAIALPNSNDTLIYYTDQRSAVHELKLNADSGEKVTMNPNVAATPANTSMLALGVGFTTADQQVRVFYSDILPGGAASVSELKRAVSDDGWPTAAQPNYLPLNTPT